MTTPYTAPPTAPQTTNATYQTPVTTTTSPTTGTATGESIGSKVKGAWNVFHGAGEALRGNINSTVDSLGEVIANRAPGDPHPVSRTEPPEMVAGKGVGEVREGLERLHK